MHKVKCSASLVAQTLEPMMWIVAYKQHHFRWEQQSKLQLFKNLGEYDE
jgi:hypothetical protein